jgi:geranylgeranyl pyrophosphate synthase
MVHNKTLFDTQIEAHLSSIFSELLNLTPELHDQWELMAAAMLYPVSAGGKRVRPQLVKLMAEALGAPENHEAVIIAGCSIELIHTYSLVHDDLPCMDNDDFRRGRPTAHKIYGDANALLIGDALLTEAFSLLSKLEEQMIPSACIVRCVRQLSRFAGTRGMIAGQWLDLAFEQRKENANWTALATVHNLKTGALLSASFSVGALLGIALSAPKTFGARIAPAIEEIVKKTETIGQQAGLAFQLIDDILDSSQSSEKLGKTAGKDQAQGKLTAVSLLGSDQAQRIAQQLTESCLNAIGELSSMTTTLPDLAVSETKFDELNRYVGELLERTS